jgi:hypothetical protein
MRSGYGASGALEIEESQPGQSFTSYVPGIQRLHNLFVHHKLLKCMEKKVQHKDLEIWERVRFVCAVEHLEKIVFEPPRGTYSTAQGVSAEP